MTQMTRIEVFCQSCVYLNPNCYLQDFRYELLFFSLKGVYYLRRFCNAILYMDSRELRGEFYDCLNQDFKDWVLSESWINADDMDNAN